MLSLMLLTANQREKQILHLAFEQHKIKVVDAEPDHASYIKALQYSPDVVLMEFPSYYTEQLHFAKNMSNSIAKKKKLLIIAYGGKMVSAEERALSANGVQHYLVRPLKFSMVMKYLEQHLGLFAPEKIVWKDNDKISDGEDYLETLLNVDILPTQKLELLSEKISSLLAFPFTVMRVLQLTEDSKSGADDLAKVITADPVISASILKMANTVFYASRNRRITTIKDAIIRIGFTETKHLTMAMSVMNTVSEKTESLGFDRLQFWFHCLSVAVISENISKGIGRLNPSEMFLAGLLHSFGVILLDEFFPELFEKLLIKTTDKGISFVETEKELMVVTHNDLTLRLFDLWKIPAQISSAIKFSDKLDEIIFKDESNITDDELRGLVVAVADRITKSSSLGNECDLVVSTLSPEVFDLIKKPRGIDDEFISNIARQIEIFRKFLKIDDTNDDQPESIKDVKILLITKPLPFFTPAELYVKSLGIEVERYSEEVDLNEYHEKFTFAIFVYENDINEDEIARIEPVKSTDRLPIRSIIMAGNAPKESTEKRIFLDNSLDLRFLSVAIQQIIEPDIVTE